MSADSLLRRAVKRSLRPLLSDSGYEWILAAAKAWDIRRGAWTEPELDLLQHALEPGETAIDLGANLGLYTYHLSRRVGRRGTVHAFEPIPFTFAALQKVGMLLRLSNVRMHSLGCGDVAAKVAFSVPIASTGAPTTGQAHFAERRDERPGREQHVHNEESQRFDCEVVPLVEVISPSAKISLIKCDIEGAELSALRGAEAILDASHPTIICEINPWFLEGFGQSVADLVAYLGGKGYELLSYERASHLLRPVATREITENNYVFLHENYRGRFLSLLAQS